MTIRRPVLRIEFWIKTPSSLQIGFGSNPPVLTALNIADGQWHHLAVTVAPATPTTIAVGICIDGVMSWFGRSAIKRTSGSWPGASTDLKLGAGIQNEPGLVGQLSEFRLWNTVLTPEQIITGMESSGATGAVIVWPLTAAPPSPAVVSGGSFVTGAPVLLFRGTTSLSANWTDLGSGYTYDLAITASNNTYYAPVAGLIAPTYAIPSFAINTTYTVSVQGVQGATKGAASTSSVTTLDLWWPTLTISQPAPPLLKFQLDWTSVDQALGYDVVRVPAGGTETVTSSNCNDVRFVGRSFWQPEPELDICRCRPVRQCRRPADDDSGHAVGSGTLADLSAGRGASGKAGRQADDLRPEASLFARH